MEKALIVFSTLNKVNFFSYDNFIFLVTFRIYILNSNFSSSHNFNEAIFLKFIKFNKYNYI